ncbi:Trm112 family protein [Streptomyces sp. BHT-5-2]|nr:Trm112 family protein [Streptomyces sp. BHT-5-2]
MKADDALLRILACPIDKGPLVLLVSEGQAEEALYNPRLRRRYPILDGIPQLLPSSGEQVSEAEHERAVRESRYADESRDIRERREVTEVTEAAEVREERVAGQVRGTVVEVEGGGRKPVVEPGAGS